MTDNPPTQPVDYPIHATALADMNEALARRFYRDAKDAWRQGQEAEERARYWRSQRD